MPNDKRRLAINIGKRAAVGVSLTIIPGTKSWTHGVPFSRDAIRATLAGVPNHRSRRLPFNGSKMSATAHLNQGLRLFFSEFVRVSLRHPSQALFFARTVIWQGRAARRRAAEARAGVTVPPIAIFSITNRCNLRCKGCYAQAIRGETQEELSAEALRGIVSQAEDLGVSFFVIAGGEPLVRPRSSTSHGISAA